MPSSNSSIPTRGGEVAVLQVHDCACDRHGRQRHRDEKASTTRSSWIRPPTASRTPPGDDPGLDGALTEAHCAGDSTDQLADHHPDRDDRIDDRARSGVVLIGGEQPSCLAR